MLLASTRRFQQKTGYRTTAETQGSPDVFWKHYALEDLSSEERDETVASHVSWYDARAYCAWSSGRLMSESEWLAASVREWTAVRERRSGFRMERGLYAEDPNQMFIEGWEWTATETSQGRAIARNEPRYFLVEGWNTSPELNRQEIPEQFFSPVLCFRVCSDSGQIAQELFMG